MTDLKTRQDELFARFGAVRGFAGDATFLNLAVLAEGVLDRGESRNAFDDVRLNNQHQPWINKFDHV